MKMLSIAKTNSFFIVLFGFLILPLSSTAQDYIWNPGGTHKDLKSFQKRDDYSGGDFRGSGFWNMGDIIEVNLDNTDFSGSWFGEMSIENTSFRGATLRSINAANLGEIGTEILQAA